MNEVERRLEAAAEETRQLARTRIPPTLEAKPAATTRGWLVLAAAFAVVVVVFGVIPWLADTTDSPPIRNSAPADAPVETVTTIEKVDHLGHHRPTGIMLIRRRRHRGSPTRGGRAGHPAPSSRHALRHDRW